METLYKRLVLLLLVLSVAHDLHAQPQHINFEKLSVDDGLSSDWVTSIVQDQQGFMWFGTVDGLNRYDGYRFTVYKNDPDDPASLAHSWVLTMCEDRRGRLWIGTHGGGLNLFEAATQSFTHYQHDPVDVHSLSGNLIYAVQESQADRDVLWVGTNKGLSRLDIRTGKATQYLEEAQPTIRAIHEDAEGILWLGTQQGLLRFDPGSDQDRSDEQADGLDYLVHDAIA